MTTTVGSTDLVIPERAEVVSPGVSALTPRQAQRWAETIRELRESVLKPGSDYMVIPGTGPKPSLLKPGAEMLLLAAGLGFTMRRTGDTLDEPQGGVSYLCTVHRGERSNVVAECEAYAGFDEERFFQTEEAATAKERALAERYQRAVRKEKCVEFRASRNNLMKMAQKRALVGAVLNATASSGLFTQDLEDETEPHAPIWDAGAVLRPWVNQVPAGPQRAGLRKWMDDQGMPLDVEAISPEQAALLLVHTGRLLAELEAAGPGPVTDGQGDPPQAPESPVEAPESPAADETQGQEPEATTGAQGESGETTSEPFRNHLDDVYRDLGEPALRETIALFSPGEMAHELDARGGDGFEPADSAAEDLVRRIVEANRDERDTGEQQTLGAEPAPAEVPQPPAAPPARRPRR